MPELDDNSVSGAEQALRRLFQAVGHEAPGTDLTDRIMARVAVTPIARPTKVEPLIGRWGWAGITVGVVLSVALLVGVAPAGGPPSPVPFADLLPDALRGIRLPQGNWPSWLMGGSACALFLVLADRFLSRRASSTGVVGGGRSDG